MDKPVVDPIVSPIGELGCSQLVFCLFIFLSKFPSGWIQVSHIFLCYNMNAICTSPSNITDACDDACQKHDFDRSIFEENVISEFDLSCKRKKWASLSQTITMGGVMTGSILFGIISDKCGRRPAFITGCMILMVFSALVSLSPFFWVYCLFRYITATATGGVMVTSFVLIMEIVGKSKREIMTILYQIPFNMGHALLPIFAYFFRHWRKFNMCYSIVHFVYIVYFCVIPESPRWLYTHGDLDKSAKILTKMAKTNGKPTESIRSDLESAYARLKSTQPAAKASIIDLFRTPNLRIKTIAMAFEWFVICLAYYGISQYVTHMSGDVFVNVAIGAWLGVPGTCICVPMTKYLGRKPTLMISTFLTAISLLLMAFLPKIPDVAKIILVTAGLFGASVTFPNVYIYGGELFPTVVRNSGIGLCSFIGRLGSMLAPFVAELAHVHLSLPGAIFGVMSFLATCACFLMPETRNTLLPETLEDGENFGKKKPDQ
ncbi:organic cation transporter protein-like [Teleopsis dalmanni]|uniref:organic cation transporter protein-like n=1 Tax=Teleopsis dalmanni TaxID=139649 RepID=UPI0018CE5733|nr:organic cation transporter protein-like [Teleopsis dalmanni]